MYLLLAGFVFILYGGIITKKVKDYLLRSVPAYGWAAIIAVVTLNVLVYEGSRLITTPWVHYDFAIRYDYRIPLLKQFVLVYIPLSYGHWVYGFYLAAREEKKICMRVFASEMIAKLICLACFLIIPTAMVSRPEIEGNDLFSAWCRLVYKNDAADNLFPSIHCLESYLLTRTAFSFKRAPKWFKYVNFPVTALVFASTLFMRQHVIVDIFAAILAVEVAMFIAKNINFDRLGMPEKERVASH